MEKNSEIKRGGEEFSTLFRSVFEKFNGKISFSGMEHSKSHQPFVTVEAAFTSGRARPPGAPQHTDTAPLALTQTTRPSPNLSSTASSIAASLPGAPFMTRFRSPRGGTAERTAT